MDAGGNRKPPEREPRPSLALDGTTSLHRTQWPSDPSTVPPQRPQTSVTYTTLVVVSMPYVRPEDPRRSHTSHNSPRSSGLPPLHPLREFPYGTEPRDSFILTCTLSSRIALTHQHSLRPQSSATYTTPVTVPTPYVCPEVPGPEVDLCIQDCQE